MRLIHDVIEDLRGHHDEELTPIDVALEELLGGERGSLADLGERFTQAGLGHLMATWIGAGPKLPIATRDLRRVLGEERVQDLATLAGMPANEFLVQLARVLPAAVHGMMADARAEPE
jgi:uncharacterized protein YidB (DUF937 family)